jgi:hypothetical protein
MRQHNRPVVRRITGARVAAAAGQVSRLTPVIPRAYITITQAIGRMAEWLCRGLQILVQRFDSASGLHGFPSTPIAYRFTRERAAGGWRNFGVIGSAVRPAPRSGTVRPRVLIAATDRNDSVARGCRGRGFFWPAPLPMFGPGVGRAIGAAPGRRSASSPACQFPAFSERSRYYQALRIPVVGRSPG